MNPMVFYRRSFATLLLLVAAGSPAQAAVTITFYSHDFGSSYPHAFIYLEGIPDGGGSAVKGNYGFTAKRVTPAILMGSVEGDIESASPGYVSNSQPHWQMLLSDTQYEAVLATIARWQAIPGKSYNLRSHNCVHFVADVARTLGLQVVELKALIQKPRSFLIDVLHRNQTLKVSSGDGAVPTLAASALVPAAMSQPPPPPIAVPLVEDPVHPPAGVAPSAAAQPRN
jgi:hypothetical protein